MTFFFKKKTPNRNALNNLFHCLLKNSLKINLISFLSTDREYSNGLWMVLIGNTVMACGWC